MRSEADLIPLTRPLVPERSSQSNWYMHAWDESRQVHGVDSPQRSESMLPNVMWAGPIKIPDLALSDLSGNQDQDQRKRLSDFSEPMMQDPCLALLAN